MIRLFLLFTATSLTMHAQEFPREFIQHLRLHSGLQTSRSQSFVGGIQLLSQYTLKENLLRGGIAIGLFYSSYRLRYLAGPTLSIKLKDLSASPFGTAGNIQVSLDHWWALERQKLLGGGLHLDLLNKILLSLLLHRDYHHGHWWLQSALALKL